MFAVLMGPRRKLPISLDISYSKIGAAEVAVSIMKIREEQVNYISMTA